MSPSSRLGTPPQVGDMFVSVWAQFGGVLENSSEEDIPSVKHSGAIVRGQEEMFSPSYRVGQQHCPSETLDESH